MNIVLYYWEMPIQFILKVGTYSIYREKHSNRLFINNLISLANIFHIQTLPKYFAKMHSEWKNIEYYVHYTPSTQLHSGRAQGCSTFSKKKIF